MTVPSQDKSPGSQQKIEAATGASIRDVIQAVVSGQITGDVHIGDKIYPRSSLEELSDYLDRAVATYEAEMSQAVLQLPTSFVHPYMFLYAFDLEDAHIFFGRHAASEAFYQTMLKDRLTVLHAKSGAGKTSLLNAGLSPRLIREGRLPVYVSTYENPVLAIKQVIAPSSLSPWPELLPELTLQEFLGLTGDRFSRRTREFVIILDQFEEFYILWPERDHRQPFIDALADCYYNKTLPIRFVIALRKDYYSDLADFKGRIPTIRYNEYRLHAMTRQEAQVAVTGPVGKLGQPVTYEPALLDKLLGDLVQGGMELPHLQIICTRLYEALEEDETTITLAFYEKLGQAEGILGSYLNDVLDKFPGKEGAIAREVLKELVSSEATKWVLSYGELAARVEAEGYELADLLSRLVNTRLLRREEAAGAEVYELAHTYLAEEVIHWIGQDELDSKRAQDLLRRELVSWRVHGTLVDCDRLNILHDHIEYLTLDNEARTLLFDSALEQGHDVGFWLGQVEEKETVIGQIANCLVDNRHLRKKIASDLRANLERPLRHPLLSTLWAIFNGVKGADRRNAARALWAFRPWLSMEELLRIVGVLGPVWTVKSLPFVLIPILLLLGGSRIWTFLDRERALPGRWVPIPEGSFVMGSDQAEADFAQTLCLEGGAFNKNSCPDPEGLLKWSGKQTEARLPTFAIMDNEVTNAQYQQCLDAGVCQAPDDWGYDKSDANKPAAKISWHEAMTYCQWLGGRLPTEGEWEKAARGPNGNYFPWDNGWDSSKANLEHALSGSVQTVAQYAEDISYYGVKNMAGNVREWTASVGLPQPADARFSNDVLVPDEAAENTPVIIRGGSWKTECSEGMGSMRGVDSISNRRPVIGFRCVCSGGLSCKSPWNWWWIWFGDY